MLLSGTLVCACLVLAAQADGHEVVTVEGLAEDGELHRVQEAFVEAGAVQCRFCTPGLVVATADLLAHNPNPDDHEVREALSGNLCRCTGSTRRSSTRCDWRRGGLRMHRLEIGTVPSHTRARFASTVDAGWRVDRLSHPMGWGGAPDAAS